jgi:uncharacterized protein
VVVDSTNRYDNRLDETLEEALPASDAPTNIVETGIFVRTESDGVRDNRAANRFELNQDGQVAFLSYERKPDEMIFIHTEVPSALRSHHLAEVLIRTGLAAARTERLRIVALCPYVRRYLFQHPAEM